MRDFEPGHSAGALDETARAGSLIPLAYFAP
jgi:hypothetical protein